MFSLPDLIALGRLYCFWTGIQPSTLGDWSCGNNRVFVRLFADPTSRCLTDTAERASDWLIQNWPKDLDWPKEIPHPDAGRRPQVRRMNGRRNGAASRLDG